MLNKNNYNPVDELFENVNGLREEARESVEFLVNSEVQTALKDYRASNKKLKAENKIYQDGFKALEDKLNGKNPSIEEIRELLQQLKSKLTDSESK